MSRQEVSVPATVEDEEARIITSPFTMDAIPAVPWHQFVFSQFQSHGDREAIVDAATGRGYTFLQLLEGIKHFSSGLLGLGVQQGDVLAIVSPNTIHYPLWVLAGLSAGAVVTTANPHYTQYELMYYLKDSTAQYVIASTDSLPTVRAVAAQLEGQVKHVIADAPGCVSPASLLATPICATWPVSPPPEHVAVLPYSSGTTGLPKGVMLTHRNILANFMQSMCPDMQPPADKLPATPPVFLGLVPFYHSYGLMGLVNFCLAAGGKVVVLEKFKPRLFLGAIEKYKVQILPLVPSLVLFLAQSELVPEYDLSSVLSVGSGAAPLSIDAAHEFKRHLPSVAPITQAFGMTELCAIGLSNSASRPPKPGAVGNLLAGSEAKIVDVASGRVLGPHARGELCLRGPQVMKGYWRKPHATADTIDRDGFLHTGDIAYYDEDGYFFIVDRIKELIKCKGLQVPPAELEAVLLSHPLVADAGVTGIPHPTAGEIPRAYVVLKPGGQSVSPDALQDFVAERVSAYKRLAGGVTFISHIPRSPTGKILRRKLKEMAVSSKL